MEREGATMSERFKASSDTKTAHGWRQGDTEGAYAMVAEAFHLDLSTEDGRRRADEYIATMDPDAAFGESMARRIKREIRVKNAVAQANKESDEEDRRLELKAKEHEQKLKAAAQSYLEMYNTAKGDLPDITINDHDPVKLQAYRNACTKAARAVLKGM
jgi:hypothetical protein